MRLFTLIAIANLLLPVLIMSPAAAEAIAEEEIEDKIDIPAEVIEESPVLQEWLREVPNVLEEIDRDPAFSTLFRFGYTVFPSSDDAGGLNIGIRDIFISHTGLTISGDYQTAFNGDRNAVGLDVNYFLFPLGKYFNFAPLVGYRYVQSNNFSTDGVRLGGRLMLSFSRTGAGDISVSQSFLNLGGSEEVGITSLSVGYAVTPDLRLSGDIERQNSLEDKDSRFGVNLEWRF